MKAPDIAIDTSSEGRERLIEAAVRLFGRKGFDGTSVRDIAEEAGVAFSLIRFHFATKDGLRDAAEAWVVKYCLDRSLNAPEIERFEDMVPIIDAALQGSLAPGEAIAFVRRAVIDGRPMAVDLVRALFAKAEAVRRIRVSDRYPDEDWAQDPMLLVAQGMGLMLVAPLVEALFGRDVYSREEILRRNAQAFRMEALIMKGLEAETGD
ncbi:MAG TPA: TetR family transcriptional regulator [Caulobacteraceae bacterium]|jgi:AcrR family transcriptional regulator